MKPSIEKRRKSIARAVVLLSGGLDSTVSLSLAARRVVVLAAVTFRYGQRSAEEEVKASRRVARSLGVCHRVISLPWLGRLNAGGLADPKTRIPKVSVSDLNAGRTAAASRAVWVPNRNGLFINMAACLAEAWGAGIVVAGFNSEEAENFPDNGLEFVRDANRVLKRSTLNGVRVVSYVQRMTKEEIVEEGVRVGAPLGAVYSCYLGGPGHCGECESCRRLARAFRLAGQWDLIRSRFKG